nr:ribonuclease III domain-containing protein [Actinomycetota bacterium]
METLAGLLEEIPDDLARQAVTHASWVERRSESWERLAFLGDVVLGLAVSSDIYPRFPRFGAGRLTKLRAQAVSRGACAAVARELGLAERVL